MRLILGIAAFCTLGVGSIRADETPSARPAGAEGLVGHYRIVSGQNGPREIPTEQIQDNTVRITPDVITAYDKDQKELFVARYRLDAEEEPCRIEMEQTGGPERSKGLKATGLIRRDGDTITLVYAVEGGEPPTGFEVKEGAAQHLFILKRIDE